MTEPKQPEKGKQARQLAASLAPVAQTVGATVLEGDRLAPCLDTRTVVSGLARQCGQLLRNTPLFLRGNSLVTVAESTGRTDPMDATRFVSWAETYLSFGQNEGTGNAQSFKPKSISSDLASKILAADTFRRELRPLRGVHDVSLPTWANAERTAVRLLPPGYDEETGIFTAPAFEYATDMPPEKAWSFLLETYAAFPFAEGQPLEKNRSLAVQVAAHFTAFARLLVLDCPRPAFFYLANQAGSGKSLLAKLALLPVFGNAESGSLSNAEEERKKLLIALVVEGSPYVFFDNQKGYLSSECLENFLTSTDYTGRLLASNNLVKGKILTTVFVTGNQLTTSTDFKRRSLLCELFCPEEATARTFKKVITENWAKLPETRARFLSALWALVNHWQVQGCPRLSEKPLPSFEDFSETIGGLVTCANFTNPFSAPENQLDENEQAWRLLLRALADLVPTGSTHEYNVEGAMKVAEELGVLDTVTAGGRDERKTFGQRIRQWRGRRFRDNQGREFEFGKKRNGNGALYPVTVFAKAGEE